MFRPAPPIPALLAAGCLGAAALVVVSASPVTAAPDPCAASQIARTVGTVAINTGTYLDSHPQTNQALTAISQQQPGPQTLTSLKAYFDANPQAGKDLQAIQQPLSTLSTRCKLPISLPALLGLLQTAQAGTPLGTGGGATPAQAVAGGSAGATGTAPAGSGPLPGPRVPLTR